MKLWFKNIYTVVIFDVNIIQFEVDYEKAVETLTIRFVAPWGYFICSVYIV